MLCVTGFVYAQVFSFSSFLTLSLFSLSLSLSLLSPYRHCQAQCCSAWAHNCIFISAAFVRDSKLSGELPRLRLLQTRPSFTQCIQSPSLAQPAVLAFGQFGLHCVRQLMEHFCCQCLLETLRCCNWITSSGGGSRELQLRLEEGGRLMKWTGVETVELRRFHFGKPQLQIDLRVLMSSLAWNFTRYRCFLMVMNESPLHHPNITWKLVIWIIQLNINES